MNQSALYIAELDYQYVRYKIGLFRFLIRKRKTPYQMAARAGFEPATKWLTATCSTAELPGMGFKKGSELPSKSKNLSIFWTLSEGVECFRGLFIIILRSYTNKLSFLYLRFIVNRFS